MHSMYHLAKIVDVFSRGEKTIAPDNSVQVQLEMWDDNLIVFAVHPELAPSVQKGQYVLVEYGFHAPQMPVNTVIKILDSKQGETAWNRQRNFFENRRKKEVGAEESSESTDHRGMVR